MEVIKHLGMIYISGNFILRQSAVVKGVTWGVGVILYPKNTPHDSDSINIVYTPTGRDVDALSVQYRHGSFISHQSYLQSFGMIGKHQYCSNVYRGWKRRFVQNVSRTSLRDSKLINMYTVTLMPTSIDI